MRDHDALFCFLDGLHRWAKVELNRHKVQDLALVIVAVESLIKFKRESSKERGRRPKKVVMVRQIGMTLLKENY